MSLLQTAASMFAEQSGHNLDTTDVANELGNLLPSSDGDLDIGALVSNFQGGGMMSAVTSWLGDGDNEGVDTSDLVGALGESRIQSFADNLGIDFGDATSGLAGMIPSLISGNSEGGSLLSGIGGDLAKNLMGRFM